ncbi:TPA: hypothetical protein L6B16_30375 [Pseudomonas aeruginosa]|nr:hypothetical protein [Pseudomonas aeruginosa]
MGLEYICDRCGAPMCAFTYQVKVSSTGKAYQERVCLNCVRIQKECGHDVPSRVYKALGVLSAQSRGYILNAKWSLDRTSCETGIKHKTKALIKHDRVLEGDA